MCESEPQPSAQTVDGAAASTSPPAADRRRLPASEDAARYGPPAKPPTNGSPAQNGGNVQAGSISGSNPGPSYPETRNRYSPGSHNNTEPQGLNVLVKKPVMDEIGLQPMT